MSTGPIVAGTDGSATARLAVDKAAELAQALDAPVHVVCVPGAIVGYEWPQRITAQEIVAKVAERLRGQGITVETHLPQDQGDAGLTLVAVADSVQAQMIVVGNKGMTGLRRLLGSLPNTVSHRARCDVLIVPTQSGSLAEFGGGAIVVGTDGSSGATLAVKEAIRLAKALDGEVHVVSTTKSADSALSAAATEAADQGVSATTHALDGDPADALAGAADEHDAVMIVLGTKGMHSDDRERFGNVADKISHKGTCSVMLVFTGDASDEAMSGAAARDAEV
jgi:nucleotide-binding universal stress UspA family protein